MEVRAGAILIDICTTTTTTHRHLCHEVANWLMCVVSVGPDDNLAVRKSDEHTKNPSWFVNRNVYLLLYFLVVAGKRETANKN